MHWPDVGRKAILVFLANPSLVRATGGSPGFQPGVKSTERSEYLSAEGAFTREGAGSHEEQADSGVPKTSVEIGTAQVKIAVGTLQFAVLLFQA